VLYHLLFPASESHTRISFLPIKILSDRIFKVHTQKMLPIRELSVTPTSACVCSLLAAFPPHHWLTHLAKPNSFLQNRSCKSTIYPHVSFSPHSSTTYKILDSHISYVLSKVRTFILGFVVKRLSLVTDFRNLLFYEYNFCSLQHSAFHTVRYITRGTR